MLSGMPLAAIPGPGTTGGRPRKEYVYDRECNQSATAVGTSLELFANYTTFTNTPVSSSLTKKKGRDTNLSGAGGQGLPSNHLLFWYEWRHQLQNIGADLSSAANKNLSEEILRVINLSYCEFSFTQTVLITARMNAIPAGVGPAWGTTTHTQAVMFGPNCVPDRRGHVVTVTGKPVQIDPQQEFRITNRMPQGSVTPTADMFSTHELVGLLIRAVTG